MDKAFEVLSSVYSALYNDPFIRPLSGAILKVDYARYAMAVSTNSKTGQYYLHYNPDYVAKHNADDCKYILRHEASHIHLRHNERTKYLIRRYGLVHNFIGWIADYFVDTMLERCYDLDEISDDLRQDLDAHLNVKRTLLTRVNKITQEHRHDAIYDRSVDCYSAIDQSGTIEDMYIGYLEFRAILDTIQMGRTFGTHDRVNNAIKNIEARKNLSLNPPIVNEEDEKETEGQSDSILDSMKKIISESIDINLDEENFDEGEFDEDEELEITKDDDKVPVFKEGYFHDEEETPDRELKENHVVNDYETEETDDYGEDEIRSDEELSKILPEGAFEPDDTVFNKEKLSFIPDEYAKVINLSVNVIDFLQEKIKGVVGSGCLRANSEDWMPATHLAGIPGYGSKFIIPRDTVTETKSAKLLCYMDVSGSMSGEPLRILHAIFQTIDPRFSDIEYVAFDDKLYPIKKDKAKKGIIRHGGGTTIALVLKDFRKRIDKGEHFHKVILISDNQIYCNFESLMEDYGFEEFYYKLWLSIMVDNRGYIGGVWTPKKIECIKVKDIDSVIREDQMEDLGLKDPVANEA